LFTISRRFHGVGIIYTCGITDDTEVQHRAHKKGLNWRKDLFVQANLAVEVAQTHRREEEMAAKAALDEKMAAQAQKLEDDKARRRLREQARRTAAKKGGEKISPQLGTFKQPLAASGPRKGSEGSP
jgi:hypothetical protein